MPMDDGKFKERASVMFGRPSTRTLQKNQQAGQSSCMGSVFACLDGCFASLMGFPPGSQDVVSTYPDPKPLVSMPLCTLWADLLGERRAGISHVEVCSNPKEGTPGWVNQDATSACSAPTVEASGDEAAGRSSDGSLFFCVFDGHGRSGHEVARLAAERLPAHLAAFAGGPLSNPTRALEEAFKKTDDDIYTAMGPKVEYSGSTGVAVIFDPAKKTLYVGNVGDSRCVLGRCVGGNWSSMPLTQDLKPDIPKEKERIQLSGGTVMALEGDDGTDVGPARVWESAAREKPGLAVSRSLGDGASRILGVIAEPVVTQHTLRSEDRFIIIATDGLWDTLGNDQVVNMAGKYLDRSLPTVAVKAMTEAVRREEGGQLVDDTTMILVSFANP